MRKIHLVILGCIVTAGFLHAQSSGKLQPVTEHNEKHEALERMIRERTYPDGNTGNFNRYISEMAAYRNNSTPQLQANWGCLQTSGTLYGDVGRTNSITFDPGNSNKFYVSTPHSGVWLTTDNGVTYTPITESLPTQSISQLVIHPTNTNILYIATGAHNMDMLPNSTGVYKSTDGGLTWNPTGLSFLSSAQENIGDLVMNPQQPNSLLAATTDGLYRTYDGGATWTRILNAFTCSARFSPADTATIYVSGHAYYRSGDAGASFTNITANIFNTFTWRYEFAVRTSAATPNVLYLMTSGVVPGPTMKQYVHKSVDNGLTFSIVDSLSGNSQAQFDVSQLTPDKYMLGFYYVMKRDGSMSALQQVSHTNSSLTGYAHSDQRGLFFDRQNDNIQYLCNDGGLYRSTDNGQTWQNITGNMQLAHLYAHGSGQQTNYKILAATLDVPPYLLGNSGITQTFSQVAEAFTAHMSTLNDSIYMFSHNNVIFTETNGNSFYNSSSQLLNNVAYHYSTFQYNACDEHVNYFGAWNDVFRSADGGRNYTLLGSTGHNPVNSSMDEMKGIHVSRANPDYMYVYYTDTVYRSVNGGATFTNITNGLPIGLAAISWIAVDPANERNIWLAFSGYSAGNKVFYSPDGGTTWINKSAGLPNVPVSSLVCQKGVPGAVYAGTDGGVFYLDSTFSTWQSFNTGLPAVMITMLDIQYPLNKLRVSTFGRGVWESDLYQPTPLNYALPPVAQFTFGTPCTGLPVNFYDKTCGTATSWQWQFPGGTPATSTSQNPVVTYPAAGSYNVTLIVNGPGGTDTLIAINEVTIAPSAAIPFQELVPDLNNYALPVGFTSTEANGDGYSWERAASFGASGIDDDCMLYNNYTYYLADMEEGLVLPQLDLSNATNPKLYFKHAYAMRALTNVLVDTLKVTARVCGSADTLLFMQGGVQLSTNPSLFVSALWVPMQPTDWRADSIDLAAFAGEQAVTISFLNKGHWGQGLYLDEFEVREANIPLDVINQQPENTVLVYPNPAKDVLYIRASEKLPAVILLTDLAGRTLKNYTMQGQQTTATLDVSGFAAGIYLLHVNGEVFRVEKW